MWEMLNEVDRNHQTESCTISTSIKYHRLLILPLALVLSLILVSTCLGETEWTRPRIEGTCWSDTKDSTGILHYDLTIYNTGPDSVVLILGPDTTIIFRLIDDTTIPENRRDEAYQYEMTLTGRLPYTFSPEQGPPPGVYALAYYHCDDGKTKFTWNFAVLYSNEACIIGTFSTPLTSFGFFEANLDEPLEDHGVALGIGFSLTKLYPDWSGSIITNWQTDFKHTDFSEPVRGEFRWYSRNHGNFIPELTCGGGLSQIRVKRGGKILHKINWGVDFGAAIKIPFYRLSYRYSSALDGYHTAELFVAAEEDNRTGMGTLYRLQTDGDIWVVTANIQWRLGPRGRCPDFDECGWRGKVMMREYRGPDFLRPLAVLGAVGFYPLVFLILLADD